MALLPAILGSKLAWLTMGAAAAAAASHDGGYHLLANFCEIVSTHGAVAHALHHEPIDAVVRAVERIADQLAKNHARMRAERGPSPRDADEERIFAKLDQILTSRMPPVRDIVADDINFEIIRLRVQRAIAREDPEEFAPDQLGGQILGRLLVSTFAALGDDEALARQMQIPVAAETLQRLTALLNDMARLETTTRRIDAATQRSEQKLDKIVDLLGRQREVAGISEPSVRPPWASSKSWEPRGLVLGLETGLVNQSAGAISLCSGLIEFVCKNAKNEAVTQIRKSKWFSEFVILQTLKYIKCHEERILKNFSEEEAYYLVAQIGQEVMRYLLNSGTSFEVWSFEGEGVSVDRSILEGVVDLTFSRATGLSGAALDDGHVSGIVLSALIDLANAKILMSNQAAKGYETIIGCMLYHFLNVRALIDGLRSTR